MATRGVAFLDGQFLAAKDAKISVFDHGFCRGDAVYDVVSTWKGWFFRLDDHLERFARSCAGVELPCPYRDAEIREILAECTQRAGLVDAYVEVFLTAGQFRQGRTAFGLDCLAGFLHLGRQEHPDRGLPA